MPETNRARTTSLDGEWNSAPCARAPANVPVHVLEGRAGGAIEMTRTGIGAVACQATHGLRLVLDGLARGLFLGLHEDDSEAFASANTTRPG